MSGDTSPSSPPSDWKLACNAAAERLDPSPGSPADIAAKCRGSLRAFVPEAWPLVEGRPFKSNWHIDAICDHLQAVSDGDLRRLVINVPPRHMKSLAVAVFWPCWDWLRHPARQWMFVSYAQTLSKRDSVKCRRLLEFQGRATSQGTLLERAGYRGMLDLLDGNFALGPDQALDPQTGQWRRWNMTADQNEKLRFENTAGGYRIATSIGGTATGEGGDILVLDDPHKADEAESEVERGNVIDWIDGTLPTRINDPKTGAIVVVMQRLHEEDATGHLLHQGGYEHLCLPAEYEPNHPFVWPDDKRTEQGALLWPEHFGQPEIDDLKLRLGSYRAAGQLQQRPAPAEGGIFKRAWWRYYVPDDEGKPATRMDGLAQSWDTAMKEKTTSDYTVGQLWGINGAQRFLLREVRGRWSLPEMIHQVQQLTEWADERWPEHRGHVKLVENTANGPEVMAQLRVRLGGFVAVNPDRDKVSRAHGVSPIVEAGDVILPGRATKGGDGPDSTTPAWVCEYIDEHAAFPNSSHDDRVDTTTQALHHLRGRGGETRRDRTEHQTVTGGMRQGGF